MKFPKVMRTHCPKCNKHTEHTVKQSKRRGRSQAHPNSQSQRRFKRKMEGYGSFPRPNPKGQGKATKKVDLRLTCGECKKAHPKKGFRAGKFELV
ncbi:MAG: 50S ribosomal protein L44e [Candidatus Aenigmarchaeota archaeon]|nr:50S ribosomal protein L44e [Candidatus Aenigmarchaeota archaeon]